VSRRIPPAACRFESYIMADSIPRGLLRTVMNIRWSIACTTLLSVSCASTHVAAPDEARLAGDRVADWQLAHMDDFAYVRSFREETAQGTGWVQAAFYIGLARWAGTTGNPHYQAALLARAQANDWRLGPRRWHADDQAIAQLYLALARTSAAAHTENIEADFDAILAAPPRNSLQFLPDNPGHSELTCQRRWCWCDALFMAPPAWAGLSRVTGDRRYRDYAVDEYFATVDYLYDAEQHLFYRDSRFFERRTPEGHKVFWSRGNGWVFAGLPLLLEALPADDPARARLLALYRQMAAALVALQRPGGYWASSLLDTDEAAPAETSGSAFITFGLAWGVNRGLLPRAGYGAAIDKGWHALVDAVESDGRLGWVQQIGDGPDDVRATDTQLYGSGAFLLAASEMIDR
jgi:unsaturated rhamnogalacturonyl hydrolase